MTRERAPASGMRPWRRRHGRRTVRCAPDARCAGAVSPCDRGCAIVAGARRAYRKGTEENARRWERRRPGASAGAPGGRPALRSMLGKAPMRGLIEHALRRSASGRRCDRASAGASGVALWPPALRASDVHMTRERAPASRTTPRAGATLSGRSPSVMRTTVAARPRPRWASGAPAPWARAVGDPPGRVDGHMTRERAQAAGAATLPAGKKSSPGPSRAWAAHGRPPSCDRRGSRARAGAGSGQAVATIASASACQPARTSSSASAAGTALVAGTARRRACAMSAVGEVARCAGSSPRIWRSSRPTWVR